MYFRCNTYKTLTPEVLSSPLLHLDRLKVSGYWIVRVPLLHFNPVNPLPLLIFSPLSFVLNLSSSIYIDNLTPTYTARLYSAVRSPVSTFHIP